MAIRIRRKGIFRLWIVLAVIFTLGFAEWGFQQVYAEWDLINTTAIKVCVDGEDYPGHEDVMTCEHRLGADQTMFQHEHISVGKFWAEAIGFGFLFYLILTAILAGIFYIVRWIVRGFRSEKETVVG